VVADELGFHWDDATSSTSRGTA